MKSKALHTAFPYTLPVMTGYVFLGMAYGIYMRSAGFPLWYPTLTALIVYGGSLEFMIVSLLLSPFAPLQTFLVALMIQARHLFYGIAMLDRFKGLGWKRFYLIYGLTDETFSVTCAMQPPAGVDQGWFMFFITLLDQCYWVTGATLGSLAGSLLSFNTQGLDFVMTAMFAVILLEHLLKEKKHYTAVIGLISALGCRLVFGADSFLVPTMACILALLTLLRRPIEKAGDAA